MSILFLIFVFPYFTKGCGCSCHLSEGYASRFVSLAGANAMLGEEVGLVPDPVGPPRIMSDKGGLYGIPARTLISHNPMAYTKGFLYQ
jgi:hypothetical protein